MAPRQKVSDKVFDMMQSVNKETDLVHEGYAEKARKIRDMRPGQGRANLDKEGNVVDYSTHKMQTEIGEALIELGVKGVEPGKWYSFPTLFPHKEKSGRWIDYGGGQKEGERADIKGAYQEASSRGETFEFGGDKESALKFGLGSWKQSSR